MPFSHMTTTDARPRSLVSQITDEYHELLDGELREETLAQLGVALESRSLLYDGRPVCTSLRPCFIGQRTRELARIAGSAVMTALSRIYERAVVDADLRRHLCVDRFDPLLEIDTGR